MIHESILSCIGQTPLVELRRLFPDPDLTVIAKLELLNPGGSVKDRPARFIVEQGLSDGLITRKSHLIESSSGNLGIALAMVARIYGLKFTCVVDPKISPINLRILQNLGAQINMVDLPDRQGGYLQTRIARVQELLSETPHGFWINQYANRLNWESHFYGTGDEIIVQMDRPIDYLVMAVSTTGTILGVARRLRQEFPHLRVVAVDAVGSVIFGGSPGPREIPGIGASRVPELLSRDEIDEVIYVGDWEAVEACRELLAYEGVFAGGSSGAVIAAVQQLVPRLPRPATVVTLLPDRGDRYVSTVYDDEWVAQYCSPPAFKTFPVQDNLGVNSRTI